MMMRTMEKLVDILSLENRPVVREPLEPQVRNPNYRRPPFPQIRKIRDQTKHMWLMNKLSHLKTRYIIWNNISLISIWKRKNTIGLSNSHIQISHLKNQGRNNIKKVIRIQWSISRKGITLGVRVMKHQQISILVINLQLVKETKRLLK